MPERCAPHKHENRRFSAAFNDRNFWAGRANNTFYTLLTNAKTLLEELNYAAALGSRMTA